MLITTPNYIIKNPGVYTLGKDLNFTGDGFAVKIESDNVVLDLNGFKIENVSNKSTTAIGVYGQDCSNVTIRGGQINGFFYGIRLDNTNSTEDGTGNNLVDGIYVGNSTFRGVSLEGAHNTVINSEIDGVSGTKIYNNAFACGIEIKGPDAIVSNNLIKEIYATGRGEGLGIAISGFGSNSLVDGNVIKNQEKTEFRSFGIWVGGYSYGVSVVSNKIEYMTYAQGWSSVTSGNYANNIGYKIEKFGAYTSRPILNGKDVNYFTNKSDLVLGNDYANHFVANGGDDIIYGEGGEDLIFGGNGNDHIFGGDGDDNLLGGAGDDVLEGGGGADLLQGGGGYDFASYKGAYAAITCSLNDTTINTGESAGDRYISVEGLMLTPFNDKCYAGNSGNYIFGEMGNDQIFGGVGLDYLNGGGGNDQLFGSNGNDRYDGGPGFDYVRYDNLINSNLTASLTNQSLNKGGAVGDKYLNIEGVIASSGDDVVYGNSGNNYIYGRSGDDVLYGYLGRDVMFGEQGADKFVFNTKPSISNVDILPDFETGVDKLLLANKFYGNAKVDAATYRFEVGVFHGGYSAEAIIYYDTSTKALGYSYKEIFLEIAELPNVLQISAADIIFIG